MMHFDTFLLRVGDLLKEYADKETLPQDFRRECLKARASLDNVRRLSDNVGVGHIQIRKRRKYLGLGGETYHASPELVFQH
ncbi:MAG: hypothetical protein V1735_05125 [Nanoarchaeota archaeon]